MEVDVRGSSDGPICPLVGEEASVSPYLYEQLAAGSRYRPQLQNDYVPSAAVQMENRVDLGHHSASTVRKVVFIQVEAFYVALGYYLLLRQKIPCLAVGSLIASLFIVVVVFGNHERELKFRANHLDPFLSHQLATTTDYEFTSTISLLMLGGFQYHTEHHLFPQVPFYRLEEARRITLEELPGGGKDVKISTIV